MLNFLGAFLREAPDLEYINSKNTLNTYRYDAVK